MTLDLTRHHAKKQPRRMRPRTLSEKRRRTTQSQASAVRATRSRS